MHLHRLAALALVACTSSADPQTTVTAALTTGNAVPVSPLVFGDPQFEALQPTAAFDGTNFFVVWHDGRDTDFFNGEFDLYGARVTPQGEVLDPGGILITRVNEHLNPPIEVASDGTGFLVTWSDTHGVHASRVSSAGAVLDPTPLQLGTGESPIAKSAGSGYVVVYHVASGLASVEVSAAGVVTPRATFGSGAHLTYDPPGFAYAANHFLVVWDEGTTIKKQFLKPDGSAEGAATTVLATSDHDSLRLASNGTAFFLSVRYAFDNAVHGTRMAGATGDGLSWGYLFPLTKTYDITPLPDGTYYAVYADAMLMLQGVHLSATGVTMGAAESVSSFGLSNFRAVSGGGRVLVPVNTNGHAVIKGLWRTPTDTNGTLISLGARNEYGPAVAMHDGVGVAVWVDDTSHLVARRYDASLAPLDAAPVSLATDPAFDPPRVVWDGTAFLAVWRPQSGGIHARRFTPQGATSPEIVVTTQVPYELSVGTSGTSVLVAWTRGESPTAYFVRGARIQGTTVVDTTPLEIDNGVYPRYDLRVGFDGTRWLVLASSEATATMYQVLGHQIASDGSVLTNPLRPSLEGFGNTTLLSPGADFAAWIETRNNETVLVGARVTMAQGVVAFVGDPAVIASGDVYTPYGVVATTHGFVVPYVTGTKPTVLRAALAAADGAPADDVELAPESELINLNVARDGAGKLLLGIWRDELPVGARRGYVRLVDDPMVPPDGAGAGPDAGSPDADDPSAMESGGGCCQSSHGTPDGAVWAVALALVLVRRRRRYVQRPVRWWSARRAACS